MRLLPSRLVSCLKSANSLAHLGIRSSVKVDLGYSTLELLYGTKRTLPGQIMSPNSSLSLDTTNYVNKLREYMAQLAPTTSRPQQVAACIPLQLKDCTHVFVRNDAVAKPLDHLKFFSGPLTLFTQRSTLHILS